MTATAPKKRGRPRKTPAPITPEPTALEQLLDLVRKEHGDEAADALAQIAEDARNYRELTAHLDASVLGLAVHKTQQ
jgi:hypothetical protein